MSSTTTDTRYVVARGTTIVGGVSFNLVADAKGYLASVKEQLTSLGVTADDVHLATVDTTTTTSDPVEYVESQPDEDTVSETQPTDESDTNDSHDVTSSVQSSDDTDTTPAS